MTARPLCALAALALAASAWAAAPAALAAGNAASDSCAKGLPVESKLIYDATVRSYAGTGSLREIVTEQTKSLVMAGKVKRDTARDSAVTAGKCLELLANKG